MITQSVITCPHCGASKAESMPTDACGFFYDCTGCGMRRAKSYASSSPSGLPVDEMELAARQTFNGFIRLVSAFDGTGGPFLHIFTQLGPNIPDASLIVCPARFPPR
jgi:hypothetical protein